MSLKSFQLCRITGKSKFLPKSHSYFPLLPPISPKDAKRLAKNPSYVPIYHLLKGNSISLDDLYKFECYQGGDISAVELYLYKVCGFVLLLPFSIESMVVNGKVTDLRLSCDTKILQLMKKNSKRWETCTLHLCTEQDLAKKSLKCGSGPPSLLLSSRKHIFEELNSNAEEDEIASFKKVEPNPEKVEKLRKKFEKRDFKLGLEPASTKITPSPFFQDISITNERKESHQTLLTPSTPTAICQHLNGNSISGQLVQTKNFGQRFIPGQLMKAEGLAQLVFIPGQVLLTKEHGEKFVPGIVLEINDEVRFVPGKVESFNDGTLTFTGPEIISTDQGLYFVTEDVEVTGEIVSVQVQGFDAEFHKILEATNEVLNEELVDIGARCSQKDNYAGSAPSSVAAADTPEDNIDLEEQDYSAILNNEIQFIIENDFTTKSIDMCTNTTVQPLHGKCKEIGEAIKTHKSTRKSRNIRSGELKVAN